LIHPQRPLFREAVPRLYAIADLDSLGAEHMVDAIAAFANAGVRWIQLRVKRAAERDLWRLAEAAARVLEEAEVALWIDDRADVAAVVGATGLHLGRRDLPPAAARAVFQHGWLGASAHDLAQVEEAERDPAVDVVAIGPVFATASKERPDPAVGLAGVLAARGRTQKPLVAIGGINAANAPAVIAAGADAVALIAALGRTASEWERRSRQLLRALRG
jgi:thiamine-phosphate pyrophosphorylase